MQIIMMPISELVAYENNPRRNDEAVGPVSESIKEFGFKVPILIDKNNVIIAGHTRLKAAKKLELNEVPCIMCDDLTTEQVNAFRLVDNKTSELASWDFELLDRELAELAAVDFDLSPFGFAEVEVPDFDAASFMVEDNNPKEPKTITCPHCGQVIEL